MVRRESPGVRHCARALSWMQCASALEFGGKFGPEDATAVGGQKKRGEARASAAGLLVAPTRQTNKCLFLPM